MHVLLAAHPEPDAPPHVLVVAAHTESPGRPFDLTCWVVGCGCGDSFPLRPVDPSEAMRALVAVVASNEDGGNTGLASPESAAQLLRDHPPAPGQPGGALSGSQPVSAPGPITEPAPVADSPRIGSGDGRFELHPDGAAWSWRLVDQHGDELAVGKLYDDRDDALAAIDSARSALGQGGDTAQVVEVDR